MKPFVAIGGVLDYMYLFAKYVGSVSVDDCAQAEIAHMDRFEDPAPYSNATT